MPSGRNALITTLISGVTGITDDTTYPNLEPLTTSNVKYGINLPANIKSHLAKDNLLILLGLGTTHGNDKTLGGHQWLVQEVYAYVMKKGLDTENEQKLAVTIAEELETYFYTTRHFTGDWYFAGRQRMTPNVWSSGRNHVVRTFLMELTFKKFGTEGVP